MQQYYTRNNNSHSFMVTAVCDKHVKSSADVASQQEAVLCYCGLSYNVRISYSKVGNLNL